MLKTLRKRLIIIYFVLLAIYIIWGGYLYQQGSWNPFSKPEIKSLSICTDSGSLSSQEGSVPVVSPNIEHIYVCGTITGKGTASLAVHWYNSTSEELIYRTPPKESWLAAGDLKSELVMDRPLQPGHYSARVRSGRETLAILEFEVIDK